MLGILIENGTDQVLMQNIGQLSKTDKCLVFSGSVIPGLPTNVLQRYEAFHFNGNIITDSLEISQQLKHL